jgi:hypothetical protein
VTGKQQPNDQHGEGESDEELVPAGGSDAEDAGIGDAATYEDLKRNEIEGKAIHCGGGGHREKANGRGYGQQAYEGPDALGISRELETPTVQKECKSRQQTEDNTDQGTLGLVLSDNITLDVIVDIGSNNGRVEAIGGTDKQEQPYELRKAQVTGDGGSRED